MRLVLRGCAQLLDAVPLLNHEIDLDLTPLPYSVPYRYLRTARLTLLTTPYRKSMLRPILRYFRPENPDVRTPYCASTVRSEIRTATRAVPYPVAQDTVRSSVRYGMAYGRLSLPWDNPCCPKKLLFLIRMLPRFVFLFCDAFRQGSSAHSKC